MIGANNSNTPSVDSEPAVSPIPPYSEEASARRVGGQASGTGYGSAALGKHSQHGPAMSVKWPPTGQTALANASAATCTAPGACAAMDGLHTRSATSEATSLAVIATVAPLALRYSTSVSDVMISAFSSRHPQRPSPT